jgi:hypothetical protein
MKLNKLMKTLKIVFTKSKKKLPIFSWLIMLWTWKRYSHVALEIDLPQIDNPMYFQANEGKVNYEYKTHFDRKHEIIVAYEIQVSEDIAKNMSKKRLEHAGEIYGTLQNLGIIYTDIIKLFGKKVDNPLKKGKNCSELVYENVLKPLYPELEYDAQKIKPHHIEDILILKGAKLLK